MGVQRRQDGEANHVIFSNVGQELGQFGENENGEGIFDGDSAWK